MSLVDWGYGDIERLGNEGIEAQRPGKPARQVGIEDVPPQCRLSFK